MRQDDDAVGGQVQVRLDGVGADLDGALEGGHGVLGPGRLVAPVADGLRYRGGALITSGQAVDPGSCEHEVESEEKVVFPGRTKGKAIPLKKAWDVPASRGTLTLWNRLLHALDAEVTSRHGKSLGALRARCKCSTDSEADACRCVGMR